MTSKRVQIWGHGAEDGRGPAINTLESYDWCRRPGVDGVELDLRRTGDDVLVVTHDALDRALRAELPLSVPDLASVLDACRGLTVNVEVKNFPSDPDYDASQRVAHLLVDLLDERGRVDDAIVSCFDTGALDVVRSRAPSVPTAVLLLSRRPAADLLDAVAAEGYAIVHPYDSMVDGDFMDAARQRNLAVNPWLGPVGADRMRALVTLGVGALITDDIVAAVEATR